MTESEASLQRKCQAIIRKYDGYVFKNNGNMFTESGRPDLVGCIKGRFIAIELKREGHLRELSEAQKIVGQKIRNAGGFWIATDKAEIVEALCIKIINEANENDV